MSRATRKSYYLRALVMNMPSTCDRCQCGSLDYGRDKRTPPTDRTFHCCRACLYVVSALIRHAVSPMQRPTSRASLGGQENPSGKSTVNQNNQVYQWSKRDKVLHLLPAIPLALFYAGTVYLLAARSIYLVGIFLLLWVATNVAIAGICTGCPYRGGYCPGISQLYFAPFLSAAMCKDQNSSARSFKINLALLGVFGIGSYLFTFYWLFVLYWSQRAIVVLALLGLLVIYMPLSFFILCPKCGYNDTCPMAKVQKAFKTAQRVVQIDEEK
jgi:hypothetical protein